MESNNSLYFRAVWTDLIEATTTETQTKKSLPAKRESESNHNETQINIICIGSHLLRID